MTGRARSIIGARAAVVVLAGGGLMLGACALDSSQVRRPTLPTETTADVQGYVATLQQNKLANVTREVHVFYYPWYGTPTVDGSWLSWTAAIEGSVPKQVREAPDDPAITDWPERGLYSSADRNVVADQMRQIKGAGIDVVVVAWWGPGSGSDRLLPLLIDEAHRHALRVTVMIEPEWTTIAELATWYHYLLDTYGSRAGFYRNASVHLPLVYVYDALRIRDPVRWPLDDWAALLGINGRGGIRSTKDDGLIIAEAENPQEMRRAGELGFDGVYTYLSNADLSQFPAMASTAAATHLAFLPSVGPGFDALRVRPHDTHSVRPRASGAYYSNMAREAIAEHPRIITITSWNEWHDGTQIEPAVDHVTPKHRFAGYGTLGPDGYLTLTRRWVAQFEASS